ncbi:hypothetical protein JG687_00018979 [Phytophthora cactorum]|uniref:RING-type domain-containing protein n=1 Tax=Phytophthora cactorum TaxID=29920 RepID=A0A329SGQ0_9STRA|nr:hypothetical protein Pcac1_g4476 [Phytophthora cactorum]KAG2819134.1 hypothetical protein PC112_g12313 [Phytophthora cactorum]KAG2820998.1 hypothetical protein PC111_g11216 [Phytophthora cactorum]KAG2854935.1 hypothetical protein PC113_g12874 [Phytophthora cactorum]KAG2900658.1 hypothetical protein PC114_g13474 [Phytophthora cactorum]
MAKRIMEEGRETKRVKLVHTATINAHSGPVQRRLRKMSEEFQPSSFGFMVQARLLCVGMSVVYRVSLSLAITNTCISRTTNGSTTVSASNGGHTTQSSWVIAMSQNKFCGFYAHVTSILHHPTVIQHLTPPVDIQHDQDVVVEWKPFEVFLRILTEVFQRYEHLQHAAFSIQADANTMNASKVQLEGFLFDCWRALEVIVPALVVEPYLPALLGREVLCIYLLMRDFLSLPESVLDANCTYANAILSLEDVEDLLPTHSEHSCSICLEPLVSSEMKGIELPESDQDSNSEVAVLPANNNFSVKLPCAHVYHENCIMSWLRHNTSCPECRAPVGASL